MVPQVIFFQEAFLLMFEDNILDIKNQTKTELNISIYISQDSWLEITNPLAWAKKRNWLARFVIEGEA